MIIEENMFHFFPEEIWENILKRLPSKSLCRFLSVSKPWYSLITSPEFLSSNLNHNLSTEINNYILVNDFRHFRNHTFQGYNPDDWVEEFLFYPDHQTMNIELSNSLGEPSFNPKLPFQSDSRFHSLLGSCNGLICIQGYLDIILWNPSIKKFVKLPPFGKVDPSSCLGERHSIGFGVNLVNGDFKVISVVREDYNYNLMDKPPSAPPVVEVFSLRRGTWAEISDEVSFNPLHFLSSHMYLNGRSHWVCKLVGNDHQCSLVSFDLSDDVFHEVSLPQQIAQSGPYNLVERRLVTLTLMEKECLAMGINEINGRFRIWAMKEYGVLESWANIYTIDLEFMRPFNINELMVTNGNILMMVLRKEDCTKLACYDLATKSVSEFNISWRGLRKYVDSLALLEPRISI